MFGRFRFIPCLPVPGFPFPLQMAVVEFQSLYNIVALLRQWDGFGNQIGDALIPKYGLLTLVGLFFVHDRLNHFPCQFSLFQKFTHLDGLCVRGGQLVK